MKSFVWIPDGDISALICISFVSVYIVLAFTVDCDLSLPTRVWCNYLYICCIYLHRHTIICIHKHIFISNISVHQHKNVDSVWKRIDLLLCHLSLQTSEWSLMCLRTTLALTLIHIIAGYLLYRTISVCEKGFKWRMLVGVCDKWAH